MRVPRGLFLPAILVAAGLPGLVGASPTAAEVALNTTVSIALHASNKGIVWCTGTLLHMRDGGATVFTVLPADMRGNPFFRGATDARVRFHGKTPALLPVQELIGDNIKGWALLRVKAQRLPTTSPELRVLRAEEAGTAVTAGQCLGGQEAFSIRVGTVSAFRKPTPRKEAVPFINVAGEYERDSGSPVVDDKGRLVGCALYSPRSGTEAQVIPILRIWEFMWRKLQPMEFSVARKTGKDWAIECRLNVPLFTHALKGAAVGIVPPTRAKQAGGGDAPPADTVWIPFEDKDGPFCLLPVAPPSAGKSTYFVMLRQHSASGAVTYHGPVVVQTNYQFSSPPTEPWLVPMGGK